MKTCHIRPFLVTWTTILMVGGIVAALIPLGPVSADQPMSVSRGIGDSAVILDATTGLADYRVLALKRSASLKAAYYRWRAAIERSGYAGAMPDPVLSYAYFIENVETRVGPQRHRLGLRQTIPWFGTLGARKDIALHTAQMEFEQFERGRLKLFYDVTVAFNELYYLGREIASTRESLELLALWETVARRKYAVGETGHPDVIRAQVELGKLEDHLLSLEDHINPTAARLRALLNLPDSVNLPVPSVTDQPEQEISSAALIQAVRDHNPDLKSLQAVVDRERAGVRLAHKSNLPGITLGLDYIETGPAIDPSMTQSGKDPWTVGVSVNLPLWFGKNKARVREAEARQKQAEFDLQDKAYHLESVAERAVFDYRDALRKVRLYRDGLLPKAEQLLNAGFAAYQAAKSDFLSLVDAQQQLLTIRLQLERSRADLVIAAAALEMLTGGTITQYAGSTGDEQEISHE
ncbi:MAG: TolC family protein [candidate division Zixibacteria bacterium]|nr:TolC family protein [candidate division Zixibacteria bacterium]